MARCPLEARPTTSASPSLSGVERCRAVPSGAKPCEAARPAAQDSRATHRARLLAELSARGLAASFEPRTLAANLGAMCDDTGGGGVSLLRACLRGGKSGTALHVAAPPTQPRRREPKARATPIDADCPRALGHQVMPPPGAEQRRLYELHQAWFGHATSQQRIRPVMKGGG